jgi:hypothetical protein
MSAHLNLVLRRNSTASADSTCLVAVFQAFQMNHYCDSISFNDFAKIIANHLEKESIESAASTLLSSELIK